MCLLNIPSQYNTPIHFQPPLHPPLHPLLHPSTVEGEHILIRNVNSGHTPLKGSGGRPLMGGSEMNSERGSPGSHRRGNGFAQGSGLGPSAQGQGLGLGLDGQHMVDTITQSLGQVG